MSLRVNAEHVATHASSAAGKIVTKIEKVHGPIWARWQDLCKLIVSLASAILVGTIAFAEKIVGAHNASPFAVFILMASWFLFLVSIFSSVLTVWYAGILQTLRARFVNSEPQLQEDASKIKADTEEELIQKVMDLVKRYSDSVLNDIKLVDKKTAICTRVALITFCLGLTAFIAFGMLQVT